MWIKIKGKCIAMSSRWILYGYKVENDKYKIEQSEAQMVKKIFELYIAGITLKEIADSFTEQKVPYSKEKFIWNKNMISRIIENEHYLGDEDYPQIIGEDIYHSALSIKNARGGKREKDTDEIKYLKLTTYCSSCGGRIRRIAKYTKREKWLCENNCKNSEFFDDLTLFSKILDIVNSVISEPEILHLDFNNSDLKQNISVLRKNNEFKYMLEHNQIQFDLLKNALIQLIEEKFEFCSLDSAVYSNPLIEYLKYLQPIRKIDVELLALIIDVIYINKDGTVTICFINGKNISR